MTKRILSATLIAAFVLPALYLVLYTVASNWMFPSIFPKLTLANWKTAFGGSYALPNSLFLGLSISMLVALFSSILALFTSRYLFLSKKADFWQKMALLPFVISPIIYAISINFFFNYLNISASPIGVAVALVFIVYPYAMLLFSGFWTNKHLAMQQLVATIGGNTLEQWKSGIWPQAKQVFFTCLYQSFLIAWFDFGFTQYIGLGKVKTLTIQVYQLVLAGNPYIAAVASVLLLVPPLLLLFINKLFVFKKI